MAIIKCVMCGGDLEIVEGSSTAECEYCGCCQTVSKGSEGEIRWALDLDALLRRGMLFLEDGEWGKACGYFEKVLDRSPECAQAYLGQLLARRRVRTIAQLGEQPKPFGDDPNYLKVLRFGDPQMVSQLQEALVASAAAEQSIRDAKEQAAAERQRLKEEKIRQERLLKEERQRQKEERRQQEEVHRAAIRRQRAENKKLANQGWIFYGAVTLINTLIFFCISTERHHKLSYLFLVLIFGFQALGQLFCALRLKAKASSSKMQETFRIMTLVAGGAALTTALLVSLFAGQIMALFVRLIVPMSVGVLILVALRLPQSGGQYQRPE